MTPNRRARVAGIVATIAAVPFLFPSAASATATLGQSHDPVGPPTPGACAGYLWTAADAKATPVLSKSHPRYVIPGLTKPAGSINVSEAITWDARLPHEQDEGDNEQAVVLNVIGDALQAPKPKAEKYEKMRVEYWKGNTMLAATAAFTPDLLDDEPFAWAITPLGRVDIFEEADRVELVHASEWMKTDDSENRFYPTSVCFNWSPLYTESSVNANISCDKAVLTMTNNGTAKAHLRVSVNGAAFDYTVASYGGSIDKTIGLTEDQWTEVIVTDLDTSQVLWSKKWFTDCVMAPTTTVTQKVEITPTTSVPTQVLGTAITAEITAPTKDVLAFTGSHTATNAGIGATLLAFGLGLVSLGRRRKIAD